MSKKARKEGNRVASLIKGNKAQFYVADVNLNDSYDDVVAAMENTKRTLGKMRSAFMLISAGTKMITIVVHVPEELTGRIDANDWITASIFGLPEGKQDEGENYIRIIIEPTMLFK